MLTCNVLGRYGRFANGLFQISAVIGFARKYGYAFGFPEWRNYDHAERFGSKEDIDVQKYFLHPLPRFDGKLPDLNFLWGYHPNAFVPDNRSLSGHFQSDKYFRHCLPLVRHYFEMKDEANNSEYCAVHYRAGDYDKNENGYHPRMSRLYYEKAMFNMPTGTKYLVFSDDLNEARNMLGGEHTYYEGKDYIEDFRAMKTCGSFIIANSSYSLMAAILSNHQYKKVICPKTWFGPAWNPPLETKDIYPEGSVVI